MLYIFRHVAKLSCWSKNVCRHLSVMARFVPVNGDEISSLLKEAVHSLLEGNIIAVPTDTVYGVAGLAQNRKAISKIYDIKNRDFSKPIAISVAEIDDIYRWGKVTTPRSLLYDLLPGPVTVVFERTADLNPELNPNTHLVGIRIPDHRFIRELARSCEGPVALTSANISSHQSTLAITEFRELWPSLDMVFDGGKLGNTPNARQGSTVVDLSVTGQYRVIRSGSALQQTVDVLTGIYGLSEEKS